MSKRRGQIVYEPDIRIQRMSVIDPDTGCWNWKTVSNAQNGYGRLVVGSRTDGTRRTVSAHKYSYMTFVGEIAEGFHVCHRCDNRRCVNPNHLFIGSHQENIDDRQRKGRNVNHVGEKNGNSKLTEHDVNEVRILGAKGLRHWQIAERFGVARSTISDVLSGFRWKHSLPEPPK